MQVHGDASRTGVQGSVPRPGGTDVTKAPFAAKTPTLPPGHLSLPAVPLMGALPLPASPPSRKAPKPVV